MWSSGQVVSGGCISQDRWHRKAALGKECRGTVRCEDKQSKLELSHKGGSKIQMLKQSVRIVGLQSVVSVSKNVYLHHNP